MMTRSDESGGFDVRWLAAIQDRANADSATRDNLLALANQVPDVQALAALLDQVRNVAEVWADSPDPVDVQAAHTLLTAVEEPARPQRPPRRIQRRRTPGWRMPRGAVFVGRPSQWGNRFRTDRPTEWWLEDDGRRWLLERVLSPAEAVLQYRRWHGEGLDPDSWDLFADYVREHLAGKDLACWCPIAGEPCHADVLLELANPEINFDGGQPEETQTCSP